jgi:3,4-dihydroxy 2-butanone 4-phosphate synthase/GTP cyclohydrolase II
MFDSAQGITTEAPSDVYTAAPLNTVQMVDEAALPTEFGTFRIIGYRSLISEEEFVVLANGSFNDDKPTLARIHSQCLTGDAFGSTRCDCGQQLRTTMKLIAKEGGAIIYQQQEGRGIGIINKIRAYALQDEGADTIEANEQLGFAADLRRYEQCGEILKDLGISRVRLISNNPDKIAALRQCGIDVVERIPLEIKFYRSLTKYLSTKREQMGHLIKLPEDGCEAA